MENSGENIVDNWDRADALYAGNALSAIFIQPVVERLAVKAKRFRRAQFVAPRSICWEAIDQTLYLPTQAYGLTVLLEHISHVSPGGLTGRESGFLPCGFWPVDNPAYHSFVAHFCKRLLIGKLQERVCAVFVSSIQCFRSLTPGMSEP